MQTLMWVFVWMVMAYLIGQLAYRRGRQDKWEEMSTEYICIDKSVLARARERMKGKLKEKRRELAKKTLDKKSKKRYNKTSYKRIDPTRRTS